MKPHLYALGDDRHHYGPYTDGSSYEFLPRIDPKIPLGWVGSVTNTMDDGNSEIRFYQFSTSGDWCASHWDTHPTDALWWIRGHKETFLTHVSHSSLDFRNTIFEHRYNRFRNTHRCWEQRKLAALERRKWGTRNVFIPFKKPLPDGYKGVRGNFDRWLRRHRGHPKTLVRVRDEYSSGEHLLELGWYN